MYRKKHRGRIQAQGGGLETSETWNQDEPLTKQEGRGLLARLKSKLTPEEREQRRKSFEDAERFIDGARGGLDAPQRRSFLSTQGKGLRVDIEIWGGTAFIALIILILVAIWLID
ncbi:MAG: hypothetical protein JNK77_07610 [Saprospiraceae bacterium]|nr:hypothetical protein [Saprospiraceae bacterium]